MAITTSFVVPVFSLGARFNECDSVQMNKGLAADEAAADMPCVALVYDNVCYLLVGWVASQRRARAML